MVGLEGRREVGLCGVYGGLHVMRRPVDIPVEIE
jgi:hypothetical protein